MTRDQRTISMISWQVFNCPLCHLWGGVSDKVHQLLPSCSDSRYEGLIPVDPFNL